MSDYRQDAKAFFDEGCVTLIGAFNLADSRAWRFSPAVRQKAKLLIEELYGLFHDSEMTLSQFASAVKVASEDRRFQSFLTDLTSSDEQKEREQKEREHRAAVRASRSRVAKEVWARRREAQQQKGG